MVVRFERLWLNAVTAHQPASSKTTVCSHEATVFVAWVSLPSITWRVGFLCCTVPVFSNTVTFIHNFFFLH